MNGLSDVIELINSQNDLGREIDEGNVIFSLPKGIPPYTVGDQGERNTAVTLNGIVNTGYFGETEIYYKRPDLVKLFEGISPRFRSREFTQQNILNTINNRYGLMLEATDLQPYTVPSFDISELETSKYIDFNVIDNSYRWIGRVTIELRFGNPRIEPLIFIQLLPMLSHPDKLTTLNGRHSGRVMTYGFDFTYWKDDLTISSETGQWENFARVQEIGALAGLGYWYNSAVIDVPVSEIIDANPLFDRVMVQYTQTGQSKGPLYFHYDVNW